MLTSELLRELLDYDAETGVFRWRKARPGTTVGAIAGHKNTDGYWRIRICYRKYTASRLAWLYVTGRWPSNQIDHANRNRSDDRFVNLREATRSQNGANRSAWIPGKVKGVCRRSNGWETSITKDGRYIYIGKFSSLSEATDAYQAKAAELFGVFAESQSNA
jgi:hypothetical protein